MILVSKAERDAIRAKLPKTGFAYSKRKIYMEESMGAIYELQGLRQERHSCAAKKRKKRHHHRRPVHDSSKQLYIL